MRRRILDPWTRLSVGLLLSAAAACSWADQACRPLTLTEPSARTEVEHESGLLWRVSGAGGEDSFLFGTIHLGGTEIVTLPAVVQSAFDDSETFVMEALLDAQGVMAFSQRMFFSDGRQLTDVLDADMFRRVAGLLADYGVPEPLARSIKPWAAYLTLSFPPGAGQPPLDLVLMEMAFQQHKSVQGLEGIDEQAAIFEDMAVDDQVALLRDLVCNYDLIQGDVAAMKAAYVARDLQRLVRLSEKYTLGGDHIYERLIKVLLTDRNHRMVDRMLPYLDAGSAFIAVGALHLPGPEGLLRLLDERGYRLEPVY